MLLQFHDWQGSSLKTSEILHLKIIFGALFFWFTDLAIRHNFGEFRLNWSDFLESKDPWWQTNRGGHDKR